MSGATDKDYVLGTHDEEIARLGLQHRVWRPTSLESWRRAGIGVGSRVIDVGAGPGYATIDLAEIVESSGEVLAIERSERFFRIAQDACRARGLTHVRFRRADLMEESLGKLDFDAAWCRWVACFVSDPAKLVHNIAEALRPGGVAVLHEYIDYRTWRLVPPRSAHESFVEEVMASWRANGGEPNVARFMLPWLQAAGLHVVDVRPRILIITASDYAWQWPARFIESNLARLLELGRVSVEWAESVRSEFKQAEADSSTLCVTPLFVEIIARKT